MVMVEVDKVQAEWIDTAYRSGDANMIEVAEKKLDAHVKTAQMMFPGMPIDLIMKDHELIGNEIDEQTILVARMKSIPEIMKYNPIKVMSCRQIAKKCNHGLNYDMGYKTFALTANIPESISKQMVEKYHQGYPGVRQWHARIREQLQRDRTLVNNFGRVRKFLDRWGDQLHKQAIAHLPQSDVADLVNIGLASIQKMQGGVMKWVDPLIQVHDSFLFQYPMDKLHDLPTVLRLICTELDPIMSIGGRNFVIPTDMKIGFDWKNMKGCALVEDDDEMYANLQATLGKLKPKSAEQIVESLLSEVGNEDDSEDRQETGEEVFRED
jgi:DNA polymerase I-like protein with 3'-5' exonuclease and polymerase domains